MRFNSNMIARGLAALASMVVALMIISWTAYTGSQVVHEVGRAIHFGLAPAVAHASPAIRIDVNRSNKGDKRVMPNIVKTISYGPPAYAVPAPVQAKLLWGKCSSLHPYTDAPQPC